jgi:putative acetyltransferase
MDIKLFQKADLTSVQKVIETSFPDEENEEISQFAFDLSTETSSPQIVSLIAKVDNQIIGYVSYSPIFLKSDTIISGYILAPLAVSTEHQKQGVGRKLINYGIDILTKAGVGVLLVYGDPDYYGQFGFDEEIGRLFVPPYPLRYPFGWTGMILDRNAIPEMPINFDCVSALSKPELW